MQNRLQLPNLKFATAFGMTGSPNSLLIKVSHYTVFYLTYSSLIVAEKHSFLSNRVPCTSPLRVAVSSPEVAVANWLLALSLSSMWFSCLPSPSPSPSTTPPPTVVAGPTMLPLRALSRDLGCLAGTIEGGTGRGPIAALDLASLTGEIYSKKKQKKLYYHPKNFKFRHYLLFDFQAFLNWWALHMHWCARLSAVH